MAQPGFFKAISKIELFLQDVLLQNTESIVRPQKWNSRKIFSCYEFWKTYSTTAIELVASRRLVTR